MKLTKSSQQDKHNKLKVAAIPLLVLILLYALLAPEDSAPLPPPPVSKTVTGSNTKQPVRLNVPAESIKQADTASNLAAEQVWNELPLTEILEHDPFRMLPKIAQEIEKQKAQAALLQSTQGTSEAKRVQEAERRELEAQLAREREEARLNSIRLSLQEKKVSGILYSSDNKAAIINSQIYYEGDLVEEGVRISKIHPEGVMFQIDSEDESELE